MQICQIAGQSQKNVAHYLPVLMQKQLNGIEVKKDVNGIENMQRIHCQQLKEQNIKRSVIYVIKNSMESKHGRNTVLMHVKQRVAYWLDWISSIGLVFLVKIYLIVTSIFSRKHVVKNVQLYQCEELLTVYDLTVEEDNCYYINGYLVSNSDSFRYLCLSLPKSKDSLTQEDLDRQKREALYGDQANLPPIFQHQGDRHNPLF
jgi:hypothetical protein